MILHVQGTEYDIEYTPGKVGLAKMLYCGKVVDSFHNVEIPIHRIFVDEFFECPKCGREFSKKQGSVLPSRGVRTCLDCYGREKKDGS